MFSTHIPYIALVAFYAYFLLFGIEKASKGEVLAESGNSFFYEIQISDHFDVNNSSCFHYHAEDLFSEQSKFENFIFKRNLNQKAFTDNIHYRLRFIPSTCNRPPPIFG